MRASECSNSPAELRKRRRTFILRYGVLGWGLPTGVVWAFLMSWSDLPQLLPGFLIAGLITFPIAGLLFGRILWAQQQSALGKTLSKRDSVD